jgi:very-short-patch-repair endonuclease
MPHAVPPKHHQTFARAMRNDATRAENLLWQQIRSRQMDGAKFRRQVPLKGYILDFVASRRC